MSGKYNDKDSVNASVSAIAWILTALLSPAYICIGLIALVIFKILTLFDKCCSTPEDQTDSILS